MQLDDWHTPEKRQQSLNKQRARRHRIKAVASAFTDRRTPTPVLPDLPTLDYESTHTAAENARLRELGRLLIALDNSIELFLYGRKP